MPTTFLQLRRFGVSPALYVLVAFTCLVAPLRQVFANDVRIANLTVHPYSGGDGEVEFDLLWDNSWRVGTEPNNWDAAWVFCKIRRNGGDWEHLKLKTTGHTIPQSPQALTTAIGVADTAASYDATTNPAVGIFIHRTNDGFGTVTANDMRLRWSYADNGALSGDVVEIRVIGVEMVYIPEAAFYAGDNATSDVSFREGSGDNDPWYIGSEGAISVSNAVTNGYYYVNNWGVSESGTGSTFTIPAAFPKGHQAFYVMKGELSQGQWVAFFNMLTNTQKTTRDITSSSFGSKNLDGLHMRNNVSWTSGEATLPDQGGGATYSGVAMNYLSWGDLAAYLDWAGLRPMSELEFEKAGRGPRAAVSGEYAWGSTTITAASTVSNAGLRAERGQSGANSVYGSGVAGPMRTGVFAAPGGSRQSSGGSFYGVMELSGNVWEGAVTVGNSAGRAFQGRNHGNGSLASSGDANVSTWPGTNGFGAGARGGGWSNASSVIRLSSRSSATTMYGSRDNAYGGRGVRTAP